MDNATPHTSAQGLTCEVMREAAVREQEHGSKLLDRFLRPAPERMEQAPSGERDQTGRSLFTLGEFSRVSFG